jgi:hypothetical protein
MNLDQEIDQLKIKAFEKGFMELAGVFESLKPLAKE